MRVVNKVFDLDRADMPLHAVLKRALDVLFEVPWLDVLSKGGVFLIDPDDDNALKLSCSHHLGPDIETLCSKIKFGQCLCGRAAQTRKIIHASCVDHRHDVRFEGIKPHGHYNVPIRIGNDLLGVLVVYLEHGTQKSRDHVEFLGEFAKALGVLIGFKQREEALIAKSDEAEASAAIAKKAMMEARRGEAAKSNFLSTMSHELRTPLNGVVGMLHVLKMGQMNEEQGEQLDVALSSADLLLSIINDVLDFSKLEHGAMQMEALPVSLSGFLKEINQTFAPLVQEKNLQFHSIVDPHLPDTILADPTRIRQICNNFISNAIKFTDTGSVVVSLEQQITPMAAGQEKRLVIKVIDTGIGLSEDAAVMVFDRFSQADNSISRKFGGTGLGLSICKQIAEAMGGQTGVDSEAEKGSTFWANLPLHMPEVDQQQVA